MSHENAPVEELACRESDGLMVSMLWHRHTGQLRVAVRDAFGDSFDVSVLADDSPLDVFYHPYAYAGLPRRQAAPSTLPAV